MRRLAAKLSPVVIASALVLTLALLLPGHALAGPIADRPLEGVEVLRMAPVDSAALLDEDAANEGPGVPMRYALPIPVRYTPDTIGTWETLDDGSLLWRLRVQSPDALSLSFGFKHYYMPAGGSIVFYTLDRTSIRGPYTDADNEVHGELWTPILLAAEAVIELKLPAAARAALDLELSSVNHGYRPFGHKGEGVFESGACNVDVICPEGDDWRDEIRSVAVYGLGGGTFCTGFLVNNTNQDLTPYFMTAFHCGITAGNAASLVVYWNYENSTCRTPGGGASGGPGDGSLAQNQTGALFRSGYSPSDFTLVELDDDPDVAFDVHWAGWDATAVDAPSAVAIHHPSTDEKRISFEDDPTTTTSYFGNTSPGNGTHIRVLDWDLGTTEGGSSGSPLFNPDHRVTGQLHGGTAACGNNSPDWYGRISVSWDGNGSAATRLRDWLDPVGGGATLTLDGRDRVEGPDFGVTVSPLSQEVCAGTDATITVDVTQAKGFTDPVTLSASGQPAGTTANFAPNPVTPPNTSTLTIGNTGAAATGSYPIVVTGTGGGLMHGATSTLELFAGVPAAPTLQAPTDTATNQSTLPTFTWQAAAGASTYTIEIATDAGFNTIVDTASGIAGTSYTPTTALAGFTTHYWRVRADNPCGNTNSATFSFTTTAQGGTCAPGDLVLVHMSDDFESGAPGWTHSGTGDTWDFNSNRTHSGQFSYRGRAVPTVSDQYLISPAITLPSSGFPIALRYWNYQRIEDDTDTSCFDGAVLEISTNGGGTWTRLENELLTDPYKGPVDGTSTNPLAGDNVWCGDPQDWLESIVDLNVYAGDTVQFRFRLGTDSSVSREGWYIDDVAVESCLAPIFADGFETGDTAAWSSTVP